VLLYFINVWYHPRRRRHRPVRSISDKYLVRPECPAGRGFLVHLAGHFHRAVLAGRVDHWDLAILVDHRDLVLRYHRVDPVIQVHLLDQVHREYLVSFVLVVLLHPVHHRCLARHLVPVGHLVLEVLVGHCYRVVRWLPVCLDFLAIRWVLVVPVVQVDMDCMVEFRLPRRRSVVDQDDQVHLVLPVHRVGHLGLAFQDDPDDPDGNILRIRLDV
jgi:hypothetical protein